MDQRVRIISNEEIAATIPADCDEQTWAFVPCQHLIAM
jgi:hypothetical protein